MSTTSEGREWRSKECGIAGSDDRPHSDVPVMESDVLLVEPHRVCCRRCSRTLDAEKLIVALERQMDVTGEFGQRLRLVPIDFGDGITLSGLDRRLCVRRHRIPPWEGAPTDTGRRARRINITVGRTRENLGGSSCCDRFQRRTARRLSMLIQISSTMTAPMKAPMIPEG